MTANGRPRAPLMTNTHADRVREVARLAGRPSRLRRREFLAEGPQAVRESLRLHVGDQATRGPSTEVSRRSDVVVEVYATEEALERHEDIARLLGHQDAPALRVTSPEVLAAMSSTVTPQGFIAVCRFVDVSLDEVLAARPRLVAVLVEVRDPGNAGTIIRAADSAGADAVILTGASVDPYNPKTVRSTVGSLFHLPFVIGADPDGLAGRLRDAGLTVLAADGYGPTDLDGLQDASAARRLGASTRDEGAPSDVDHAQAVGAAPDASDGANATPVGAGATGTDWRPDPVDAAVIRLEDPAAWLFGNEAQGLPSALTAAADARVSVPIYGAAESLNVGTAATVCLYASARAQRLR